jgi:DNA-binding transcriptional ArsR family regulator
MSATIDGDLAEVVARRLAALGEPTRLKLVVELRVRENATVHELARAVDAPLPNVSKHLQILYQAGLVVRSKEGTFVRYRLAGDAVSALVTYAVRILGSGTQRARLAA